MTPAAIGARHLTDEELRGVDAYWRAANYVSVGQIYLLANPLLREPLRPEHIKPRLLGHWGTAPGLNLIYAHFNRLIRQRDRDVLFVTGPGHGGPVRDGAVLPILDLNGYKIANPAVPARIDFFSEQLSTNARSVVICHLRSTLF
ncbi:hypothetical protein OHA18_37150 [Kribbella sp. NBC_00709]|uniref:hypothetical protein n=1 Tax=Kribbella sp. NBC_00709 TaxID=2975972 RepID=UPI002E2D795F|nr:hypothetical protein [Kribbella sp. NBC_00709]